MEKDIIKHARELLQNLKQETCTGRRSALRSDLACFAILHLPVILDRLEALETEKESLRVQNAAWEEGYSKQLLELNQLKNGTLLEQVTGAEK